MLSSDCGLSTTRSNSPSSSRACGAICAPLPYWREFAIAINKAEVANGEPPTPFRGVIEYSRATYDGSSLRVATTYPSNPRRAPGAAIRMAMRASSPMPATLKNSEPFSSPASIRRADPDAATSNAAAASSGRSRSRARPLPEPPGMMAIATGVPANAAPTPFTVPSPPHATTNVCPASTAAAAKRCASSGAVVMRTSASNPPRPSDSRASAAQASSVRARPGPAMGLMTTVAFIRATDSTDLTQIPAWL